MSPQNGEKEVVEQAEFNSVSTSPPASIACDYHKRGRLMSQRVVRSLSVALNSATKYAFRPPEFDVDYLIIGGGELLVCCGTDASNT
jgi:hypothetical protein